MQRHGWVIKVKPEMLDEYKKYHANIWPEIADMIKACNIQNYSIYLRDDLLFSYLEYVGDDFDADMAKMAEDPKTLEWWDIMKPMQEPLDTCTKDEWWGIMEEVFHLD
jgi:L-rhamnose mutarotase